MKPITNHNQPWEPTHPNPQTDDEKRQWIAEARSIHRSGYMPNKNWPLPELYPGQYEDLLALTSP